MLITVVSIFPGMFEVLNYGIIKRAKDTGLVNIEVINLRDFAADRRRNVDDYDYGGGTGMVMKADVFFHFKDWYEKHSGKGYVLLMSPKGSVFTHEKAVELANKKHLVLLCGRYKGVDERVKDMVDEELSIGDFVLSGGELAAMVIIDAVSRQIPGVVGKMESVENDSFYNGYLDYPHYTRPANLNGKKVPDVLLSGAHEKIDLYRKMESIKETILKRPDLFIKKQLNEEDKKMIAELIRSLVKNKDAG
ncbi:MAG: tRNA (guanosine(37)-N1)-methyltransferase TrmD [Thermotoga sp.]|nr:tRNA (guanosine(37)-N1)-methyltransferase TrmD [Thermotogota bacterium]RKX52931.1 MAG: tRNA (guanosine(37)-N1)-methyltransferase TrmD [Thermotoga sp.]